MNDRYLFKAKTACIVGTSVFPKKEGEWVKGYLRCDCGKWLIYQFEYEYADQIPYEVDPSTICQCTGLKDKNGTLIWENDICDYDDRAKFIVKFGEYNEFTDKRYVGFYAKWEDRWDGLYREDLGYWNDEVEVIGSIFYNPELLEVG